MEKIKIFAAVQIRLGSQRLPNKALADLGGKTVLERIVQRIQYCRELDGVMVCTSDESKDTPLQDIARKIDVPCYRGSEKNLIQRFLGSIDMVGAGAIVRITGDCPLVDFQLIDRMVKIFKDKTNDLDAVTNIFPPTFPDGLDIEIFKKNTFLRLDKDIVDPLHREWFTMYLYQHQDAYRIINIKSEINYSSMRWTLDYPEDLNFIRNIYSHFKEKDENFTMDQILEFLKDNPEIIKINQKYVEEVSQNVRGQSYQNIKKEDKLNARKDQFS